MNYKEQYKKSANIPNIYSYSEYLENNLTIAVEAMEQVKMIRNPPETLEVLDEALKKIKGEIDGR